MTQRYIWTAVAVFSVIGIISHSPSIAEAGQGNAITHLHGMMSNTGNLSESWQESRLPASPFDRSLIKKVGADSYSGMSGADARSGSTGSYSQQAPVSGGQSGSTGDYKFSSPGNDSRYGSAPSNPSDNYFKKESSGSATGPYGGSIYGGLPSTPSADPMIKDLSR